MDAIEAISQRRMLPRVGEQPPSRADISELLELAVRAPVHHQTNPWRFYVLQGAGRDRLAAAMADEAIAGGTEPERARDDAAKKVARAPVIIVVTCVPSREPKVVEAEEFASVAMAIQNILLAAYAKGLGAMLRTGPVAYHPAVSEHLGLGVDESVVGCIYLGHPDADRDKTSRIPAVDHTLWLT